MKKGHPKGDTSAKGPAVETKSIPEACRSKDQLNRVAMEQLLRCPVLLDLATFSRAYTEKGQRPTKTSVRSLVQ